MPWFQKERWKGGRWSVEAVVVQAVVLGPDNCKAANTRLVEGTAAQRNASASWLILAPVGRMLVWVGILAILLLLLLLVVCLPLRSVIVAGVDGGRGGGGARCARWQRGSAGGAARHSGVIPRVTRCESGVLTGG
jgi:hypothetical protein